MSMPADRPLDMPLAAAAGRWGQLMVAAAAGLGMFLALLDFSVNVALPAMTADLNTDFQTIQWIIVVFIATRAGLVMGAGSFADRFGLKVVYLFGTATYLVSMVCITLSPNLGAVVGFRVLQAVGAGCLFAVSPAIAARVFPPHRRGLGMGFTTACQALGMLAGTLGAGLLVELFGWQVVFYGRIPFTLVAIFLAARFMSPEPRSTSGPPFDVTGAVTLMAALLCLVIGLRLGRSIGWDSPVVLALLALSPLMLAAFWRAERRAQWPILPGDLLRVRGFVTSGASMFLAHLGVFVIWFIFPFYISDGLGRGALALGMMLAALALLSMGTSALGGWLCDRAGTLRVGLAGLLALAGGLLWMGFLDGSAAVGQVALRISIVGIGLGLFQAAAYALMMGSVPARRFGTASATLSLTQAFGTVLSVAVIGGILAVSQEHHLARLTDAGVPMLEREGQAFILAFQDVFRLGAAIALVGAGVFALSRRRRVRNGLERGPGLGD